MKRTIAQAFVERNKDLVTDGNDKTTDLASAKASFDKFAAQWVGPNSPNVFSEFTFTTDVGPAGDGNTRFPFFGKIDIRWVLGKDTDQAGGRNGADATFFWDDYLNRWFSRREIRELKDSSAVG